MKKFLTLILIIIYTETYSQSTVTDFQFEVENPGCGYVDAHFYFQGSIHQDVDSCYWYFGDGVKKFSDSSNGANHHYSHPGIYSVELVLWKNGVQSSVKKDSIVTVLQRPAPSFSYELSDSAGFAPLIVNFKNTTSEDTLNPLIYDWEIWGLDSLTEENPTVIFSNPGTYYVQLRTTNEWGCFGFISDQITIKDTLQRGEFPFTISSCYQEPEIPPCGFERHFEIDDDTLRISGFYYGNCGTEKTATVNYAADTLVVKIWETGGQTTCGCGYCFEINVPDIYADSILVNFNEELKNGNCYFCPRKSSC